MRRELLIAAGPGEWRVAWLEDGEAVELHIERGDSPPPGSIRLGRVVRLVGGLGAALVDIGAERPGFLPLGRDRSFDEGARVIVEIRREAQRGKGALLSARIADDRLAPLAEAASRRDPPAQLDPAPGFAAAVALRLPPAMPDSVLTDDPALLRELRAVFPDAEVAYAGPADWPLDLDALVETALAPSLSLSRGSSGSGGGSLHIAETQAAVLVDVDTGSPETGAAAAAAMDVNLAAAAALARQLRLRQLGGGVIIDFAALDGRGRRERVRQAAVAALAGDPAQPQVLGWTRLGHLEIVRPRRLRPLSDAMLEPGTTRKSAVALAFECLRVAAREARARPAANWRLVVAPDVAAALRGATAAEAMRRLEERLGRRFAMAVAPDPGAQPFDIMPL